jgi:hypothetical protein
MDKLYRDLEHLSAVYKDKARLLALRADELKAAMPTVGQYKQDPSKQSISDAYIRWNAQSQAYVYAAMDMELLLSEADAREDRLLDDMAAQWQAEEEAF